MATPEELNQDYFESMARGRTGVRLAEESWTPIPAGSSPAVVSPAPVPPSGPTQWISRAQPVVAPGGGGAMDWDMIERSYGNLPIAQAQTAINAAMQYQAMRGYQNDLDSGKPANVALARWAPMMFGKLGTTAGISGAASMIRATAPKPQFSFVPGTATMPASFQAPGERPVVVNRSALPEAATAQYSFVPGTTNAPATYQAPGKRPVIVPRSALPISQTLGALDVKEVAPGTGIYVIRSPGSVDFKIATARAGGELNEYQRSRIMQDVLKQKQRLSYMDPADPNYGASTNIIAELEKAAKTGRISPAVAAPMPEGVGATNAPAIKPAGKAFRDRSGKTWRYLGTAADPKTDRNPNNWVEE